VLGVPRAEGLEARVEEVLRAPGYQMAHWGLLVVDGRTGQTVYQKNADQMFSPASVTKLFSTAAALIDLGPDFRFRTPVVRRGEIDKEGILHGDLILIASGDLSLGGRTGPDGSLLFKDNDHSYAGGNLKSTLVPTDPLAGLDDLARQVGEAGIKAVTGDVLIDDRLFEPATSTGSGPSRVTPIVVNDNLVDVEATPAETAGEPASVRMIPATSFVTMDAQVETIPEGERPWVSVRRVGPRRFQVRGRLPVGHRAVVKVYEVEEPAAFARALFIERLRRRGVRVAASPLGANAIESLPAHEEVAKLPRVAEYTSPKFSEFIRVILKVSQNLHASTLPLLIAAHHGERTLTEGLQREGIILKQLGVDIGTISFGGGAGGSRVDLVTPRATVALLRAMAQRPEFSAFEAALPVLGRDGTLAQAVAPDSPARGHARAKTGTYWVEDGLTGKGILTSKALAGYLETASGRPLVFAFFLNGVPLDAPSDDISEATTAAGRLLGKLCEVFYDDADLPAQAGQGLP
ncbi:MAG: D-alanyl-D-alanine carboxypeptidase/D-alanyl-D-alanine-endopeptidase, partial [Isosphaeraceae bacterium]|nr:D-alanyl-D-alanine carboxypeptidase/D-alanyl-D-alanine-endopeptidase [Isosphaeraceae bacterium]